MHHRRTRLANKIKTHDRKKVVTLTHPAPLWLRSRCPTIVSLVHFRRVIFVSSVVGHRTASGVSLQQPLPREISIIVIAMLRVDEIVRIANNHRSTTLNAWYGIIRVPRPALAGAGLFLVATASFFITQHHDDGDVSKQSMSQNKRGVFARRK